MKKIMPGMEGLLGGAGGGKRKGKGGKKDDPMANLAGLGDMMKGFGDGDLGNLMKGMGGEL